MKKLILASLMVLGFGLDAQAQYLYPAPVVPVYPAPVVTYPAPVYPVLPVTPVFPVSPLVPVTPVAAPLVPVAPLAPGCYWLSVPVTSWQWVQGIFGGWRPRLVTTFQNQLICR